MTQFLCQYNTSFFTVYICHLKLGHEPKRRHIAMRMLMVLLLSYFLSSLAAIVLVAALTLQLFCSAETLIGGFDLTCFMAVLHRYTDAQRRRSDNLSFRALALYFQEQKSN